MNADSKAARAWRAARRALAQLRTREHETARDKLRHAEVKYRTLVEQLPLVTYIDALSATASTDLVASVVAAPARPSAVGRSDSAS